MALLIAALCGCASAPMSLDRAAGAVEVANRTTSEVEVELDGRREATVRPGERVLVDPVHAGSRRVGLSRQDGRRAEVTLEVPPGGVATQVVLPGMLGAVEEELLPEPPAFGSVEVESALPGVAAVAFDGVERGKVMPGERRLFRAIPSGAVLAVARPDAGGRIRGQIDGRLEVVAGGVARWRVAPEGRPVEVTNATAEAVEVRVDGAIVGRVEAGAARVFLVTAALHALEARGEPSRRRFEQAVDLRAAAEASWRIEGGSAAVVVENALTRPVEVRREGASVGVVAPGQRLRLEGQPAGAARFVATEVIEGEGFPTVREVVLHLEAGDEGRWRVEAATPGLRVENRTDGAIELYASASGRAAVRLGRLAQGAATYLHGLAKSVGEAGSSGAKVEVEAWTTRGVRLGVHSLTLSVGGGAGDADQVWQVRSPTGGMVVSNQSGESVWLKVDGADLGEVANGASLGVGALSARPHLIEAKGRLTGTAVRRVVEVEADEDGARPARVTIGASRVEVRLKNATGEAVVAAADGARGASAAVASGAVIQLSLPPGAHAPRFVGVSTGTPYVARLEVPEDASVPVEAELLAARAELALVNALDEAVAVSVGGVVLGSVEAGARGLFEGLRPGRTTVEAVGVTTGRFRSAEAKLKAGATREVTLARRLAVLIVENRSDERLEVTLQDAGRGGARRAVVMPRTAKGFGELIPGAVDVSLLHAQSGTTQRQRVALDEGERRLLMVDAPAGIVRVDNLSGAPVSVRRGKQQLALLEADAKGVELSLEAGTHELELVWESGARGAVVTRSVEVAVRGGVVSALPIRPLTGRLAVVNRTAVAAEVLAGERVLGVVEAGGSAIFEGLAVGDLALSARPRPADDAPCDAKGCGVGQRATLRLDGGQTASWVLVAP